MSVFSFSVMAAQQWTGNANGHNFPSLMKGGECSVTADVNETKSDTGQKGLELKIALDCGSNFKRSIEDKYLNASDYLLGQKPESLSGQIQRGDVTVIELESYSFGKLSKLVRLSMSDKTAYLTWVERTAVPQLATGHYEQTFSAVLSLKE